jgi:tetratricopeptide (TPR) repeat protein
MTRKNFFILGATAALFIFSAVAASAQTSPLRGHVVMQQQDGKKVPAVDAAVDIFRRDIKGNWSTKTDKKGEFHYPLPLVGDYVVAASMTGAQPAYVRDVNVKQEFDYEIVLTPGDGSRLSFDEIKKRLPGGGTTAAPTASNKGETAEEKAKREEYDKKKAQNDKNQSINEIVGRTFTAGNAALTAHPPNYDEAIKQYQDGLAADPEQGALYTQVASAYRMRGIDRYNASLKLSGDARTAAMEPAKKDFADAAQNANKAVELVKKEEASADAAGQASQGKRKLAALIERVNSMNLFVTKVDQAPAQADAALVAYHEYIDAETDPAKKSASQMAAAQMLLDAGQGDKAFLEYKAILVQKPDDPDANLGAGLALYGTGDKAKYQEAANYLQHFVDTAPNDHKFKADAVAVLQNLKSTENVVPEKIAPRGRRRP